MTILRYVFWILWSAFCISSSLIAILITGKKSSAVKMARTWWAPAMLKVVGVKLSVEGLENIDNEKPYIVASNHGSYLDIPVMFKALPINLYFIAKKELQKLPFLGWYMNASGMIFIDRSDRRKSILSMKEAARLIQEGRNVMIFPEGSRTLNGELKEFKKGGFHLAKGAKVEILPVGIKGTFDLYPKKQFKFIPGYVHVKIGKPISSESFEKIEDFMDYTKLQIKELSS